MNNAYSEHKKIVVLGSNAFSGQDFIDLLLDNPNHEVIGVSRRCEASPTFLKYKSHKNMARFRFFQLDLNDDMPELLSLLDIEKPDYIVNFAAQSEVAPSWEHPEHWFETNCVALAKLINHLRRQRYLQKYLHVSSPEIYGTCQPQYDEAAPFNPSTPYAASKAAADFLLQTYHKQFEFPVVTVRATNVYGARQQLFKIIPASMIRIRRGDVIELHGGGTAVKSYIHIRDVSRGELEILMRGEVGNVYHLSPDSGIAIHELVEKIADLHSVAFNDIARRVGERPGQDAAYVIDSTKARTTLSWSPSVSLEEGLLEVKDWVAANWNELGGQVPRYEHRP